MGMVKVRIKRFGNQFASCGVGLRPPEKLIGDPTIKRRCPKLVPGQVVELPDNHNILNQETVEVVRHVRDDEILRPWVFSNAEEAAMANPSKARFDPEQIAAGLAMADAAIENSDKHRAKAQKKRAASTAVLDDQDDGYDDDDQDDEQPEPEAVVAKRSQNRQTAEVYEDAKPIVDDPEPAPEPEVVRRGTVRRARNRG